MLSLSQGQNIEQSTHSVSGIARGLYDRVFRYLVEKCNETLVDLTMKKVVFIGVLDIAGFEIFKVKLRYAMLSFANHHETCQHTFLP